jgi:hypothetical protein
MGWWSGRKECDSTCLAIQQTSRHGLPITNLSKSQTEDGWWYGRRMRFDLSRLQQICSPLVQTRICQNLKGKFLYNNEKNILLTWKRRLVRKERVRLNRRWPSYHGVVKIPQYDQFACNKINILLRWGRMGCPASETTMYRRFESNFGWLQRAPISSHRRVDIIFTHRNEEDFEWRSWLDS